MKLVFFGDSITDMGRNRTVEDGNVHSYGDGYVFFVAGELLERDPNGYEIINRGDSGNRIYQLYARLKKDVWNEKPDFLTILVGVNDIEHKGNETGTDLVRWEKIYRMILEETRERFPEVKIILMEPFHLYLEGADKEIREFKIATIERYREILTSISKDYCCEFILLQDKFEAAAKKYTAKNYLYDGTHPSIAGSKLIAKEWLKVFEKITKNNKNKRL
jgi:lysophospholipase L1-like esterase